MHISTADRQILNKILERKRKKGLKADAVDLKAMLKEILLWAHRFVPSESGSILLDDPILTQNRKKPGLLYFVACYGAGSANLVKTSIPVNVGIVGQTYSSGRPYISKKVSRDKHFYSAIDKKTSFETKSIICAPVRIKGATIGVIELINRLDRTNYDKNDLKLLEIFAEYTSTLIQNSLDAKRFGELSIVDNLTGLYNDRYFYDRLAKDLKAVIRKHGDLSIIFFDIDRFKVVNDTYGHLAGSRVLTEIGGILHACLAGHKGFAIRYGGDEFVVVLPEADIDKATGFAHDIRRIIEGHVFLKQRLTEERPIRLKGVITASVGVASLRKNVELNGNLLETRDALIKQADMAMYESKRGGRNMVTISQGAND